MNRPRHSPPPPPGSVRSRKENGASAFAHSSLKIGSHRYLSAPILPQFTLKAQNLLFLQRLAASPPDRHFTTSDDLHSHRPPSEEPSPSHKGHSNNGPTTTSTTPKALRCPRHRLLRPPRHGSHDPAPPPGLQPPRHRHSPSHCLLYCHRDYHQEWIYQW